MADIPNAPSSIRIPGRPEPGDRCPNCDWPIPEPKASAMDRTPSQGVFVCTHCNWSLTTPRFEEVR